MHRVSRWRLRSFRARFFPEFLESRQLLSTAPLNALTNVPGVVATPEVTVTPDRHGGWGGGGTNPTPTPPPTQVNALPSSALTPAQVQAAYGVNKLSETGAGETIAIVDAYGDSTIQSDLIAFDKQFGLAAANLTVVNENGGSTLPATDPGWALETALDVEWAHAIAPGVNILLVEASSASLNDLEAAISYAATKANVVSMSWGSSEFAGETAFDSTFARSGVTFVAATGDSGGLSGAEWPSVSPNVVGVGGTTLSTSSTGAYLGETAWSGSGNSGGSGGGVSSYESLPSFQSSTLGQIAAGRTTPDVSFDANPNTGFAVYDSTAYQGESGWYQVGGTSAGTPQWSALVALADQARAGSGLGSLSSQQTLSTLYTTEKTSASTSFHDVTSGSNAHYNAGPGYDLVTGLGSPQANNLVPKLAGLASPAATVTASAAVVTVKAEVFVPTGQAAPHDIVVVPVVVNIPAGAGHVQQTILLVTLSSPTPLQAPPANASPVGTAAVVPQAPTSLLAPVAQPLTLSTTIGLGLRPASEPALGGSLIPGADIVPERDEAPPEAPAPAPAAAAQSASVMYLHAWDAAIEWYVANDGADALPPVPPPATVAKEEQSASTLETTLMAGAAVALWGTWELRSRFSDRRRKVRLPDEPSVN